MSYLKIRAGRIAGQLGVHTEIYGRESYYYHKLLFISLFPNVSYTNHAPDVLFFDLYSENYEGIDVKWSFLDTIKSDHPSIMDMFEHQTYFMFSLMQ